MNKEAITRVADAIESAELAKDGIGFNMALYFDESCNNYPDQTGHHCDTVACIAGWTCLLAGKDGVYKDPGFEFFGEARSQLGLDEDLAVRLFYGGGRPPGVGLEAIAPSQAVRTLRHLAETGEVNWSV